MRWKSRHERWREREKGTPGGHRAKKRRSRDLALRTNEAVQNLDPGVGGGREGEEEEEEQNCLGWLSNSRVAAVAEVPDTQWRWRRGELCLSEMK